MGKRPATTDWLMSHYGFLGNKWAAYHHIYKMCIYILNYNLSSSCRSHWRLLGRYLELHVVLCVGLMLKNTEWTSQPPSRTQAMDLLIWKRKEAKEKLTYTRRPTKVSRMWSYNLFFLSCNSSHQASNFLLFLGKYKIQVLIIYRVPKMITFTDENLLPLMLGGYSLISHWPCLILAKVW